MANDAGSQIAREERQRTSARGAGVSLTVLASTFFLGFFSGALVTRDIRSALLIPVALGLVLILMRHIPFRLRRSAQILAICCAPGCMLLSSQFSRPHAAPAPLKWRGIEKIITDRVR